MHYQEISISTPHKPVAHDVQTPKVATPRPNQTFKNARNPCVSGCVSWITGSTEEP
ncbi:MAG: hypothetical protein QG574_2788 [Cyanobacteriota bacterium erpe_2018_sw_21hr_WHONDRS-SW48-000092_B_bin.40]|jgi:hypothetical protein|nr:hypothetical protein [Cyanobacteriota bacterium erpe_2018_sw_21hr_WHONDRS-SW48-000092_B_bin.40]